ncbi:calphotin-like [Neocloeon triangulifer]|uniref:calphotin-like n=1 Tax=Neocloeon triangulifer TaxID=2078957 RepID=UPI00286F1399|nr:calphotin-like [Neocloeon triangulifer]
MHRFIVVLSMAVAVAQAQYLLSAGVPAVSSHQYHAQDELGQFSYGYAGGPSAKHEVKTFDGVTRGGYSYVDANGLLQSVSYVADPINGFRVAATNLPAAPAHIAAAPVAAVPQTVYLQDAPDVAAAKAAHFAAHAEAKARLLAAYVLPMLLAAVSAGNLPVAPLAYSAPLAYGAYGAYGYAAGAPLIKTIAAPAVATYAAAPAIQYAAAPAIQYAAAPVVKTVAAPVAYAAPVAAPVAYAAPIQVPVTKTVHYENRPVVTGYSSQILKPALPATGLITPSEIVTKQRVLAPARSIQTLTPQVTRVEPEVVVSKVEVDVPVAKPVPVEHVVRSYAPQQIIPVPAAPVVKTIAAPAIATYAAAPALQYAAAPALQYAAAPVATYAKTIAASPLAYANYGYGYAAPLGYAAAPAVVKTIA